MPDKNSFQDKVKQKLFLMKQWVKVHPQTTFMYGLIMFLSMSFILIGATIIGNGAKVLNGQVPNPLTFNQVTGIVILLSGGFLVLFAWFITTFFLSFMDAFTEKEEQRKKRLHAQNSSEEKENP